MKFDFYFATKIGLASGMAGSAVAVIMVLAPGSLGRFLPPLGLMVPSACFGAVLAGMVGAAGFGRAGIWAHGLAALCAILVTALGALLAASGLMGLGTVLSDRPSFMVNGAGLGLLAVADGVLTSPAVALVWVLSMAAVHLYAAKLRRC